MEETKKIKQIHSIDEIESMLKYFKNQLVIKTAYKNNEIIGFRMALLFENIAWEIYVGNSLEGRKLKCSYSTLWSMLEECKTRNINTYDIGGVYDENLSHFKRKISDNDFRYPGEYEKTNVFLLDKIISFVLKTAGTNFLNKKVKKI